MLSKRILVFIALKIFEIVCFLGIIAIGAGIVLGIVIVYLIKYMSCTSCPHYLHIIVNIIFWILAVILGAIVFSWLFMALKEWLKSNWVKAGNIVNRKKE